MEESASAAQYLKFMRPDLYEGGRSHSPLPQASPLSTLRTPKTSNQVFYTLGSSSNIREFANLSSRGSTSQPRMVGGQRIEDVNNPITGKQFYPISQLPPMTPVAIVPLSPPGEPEDYTKNLSESLFLPAMKQDQLLDVLSTRSSKLIQERKELDKTRRLKSLYGSAGKSRAPKSKRHVSDSQPGIQAIKRSLIQDYEGSSVQKPKKRLIFGHSRYGSQIVRKSGRGGDDNSSKVKSAVQRITEEIREESRQRKKLEREIRSLSKTLRSWRSERL